MPADVGMRFTYGGTDYDFAPDEVDGQMKFAYEAELQTNQSGPPRLNFIATAAHKSLGVSFSERSTTNRDNIETLIAARGEIAIKPFYYTFGASGSAPCDAVNCGMLDDGYEVAYDFGGDGIITHSMEFLKTS